MYPFYFSVVLIIASACLKQSLDKAGELMFAFDVKNSEADYSVI